MSVDAARHASHRSQGRQVVPYRTAFETGIDFRAASDRVREQLRVWLQSKEYDVEKFDAGDTGLARGVSVRHAATNETCGWQLKEDRGDGITWVSTVAVARDHRSASSWIALNVEPVSRGELTLPPAAPPKLVRLLLGSVDAFDGEAQLRDTVTAVNTARVDDLLDIVCAEDRRLPVVVAAAPADIAFERWRQDINKLVRYLPGLAAYYILDPVAVTYFNRGIGETHRIGPGAARTFLPNVDPAITEDAIRHRVLSRRRIETEPARAARVLAVLPRQIAAAAIPSAAAQALQLSIGLRDRPADSGDDRTTLREEVKLLTDLLETADDTEQQLRTEVSRQQEQILDLASELQILREESERRSATVKELRDRLVNARLFTEAYTPVSEPPPLPTSFAELLDRIGELAPLVRFTGDESVCLDLDEQLQSSAWSQAAWQGLLALADYAKASSEGQFSGDFKMWCESPPDGNFYAISTGKVARDESPTVRNNRRFSQARMFSVPQTIEPDGKVFMGAHIRLGNSTTVAPRMHFHDATSRDNVVYVGYIGPHLPNTLT